MAAAYSSPAGGREPPRARSLRSLRALDDNGTLTLHPWLVQSSTCASPVPRFRVCPGSPLALLPPPAAYCSDGAHPSGATGSRLAAHGIRRVQPADGQHLRTAADAPAGLVGRRGLRLRALRVRHLRWTAHRRHRARGPPVLGRRDAGVRESAVPRRARQRRGACRACRARGPFWHRPAQRGRSPRFLYSLKLLAFPAAPRTHVGAHGDCFTDVS